MLVKDGHPAYTDTADPGQDNMEEYGIPEEQIVTEGHYDPWTCCRSALSICRKAVAYP